MKLDARLTLFMTLVSVFVMSLLLGNLIAGKLTYIPIGGEDYAMSVGGVVFPLTFVLTDILNEFYGRRVVQRVTLIGLAMTALAFALIHVVVMLSWFPPQTQPTWGGVQPDQFDAVFSSATRMQIASMAAFVIGQLIDISVFFLIKRVTGNRMLWLRATGSTAVSQLIDTVAVGVIGFGGIVEDDVLVEMIITAYMFKLAIAVLMTPVIYALHALIERVWKLAPVPLEVKGGDVGGRDEPGQA